jgi:hypothetical protein
LPPGADYFFFTRTLAAKSARRLPVHDSLFDKEFVF